MEKVYKMLPGDIVVSQGKGLLSNFLRVIQSIRADVRVSEIWGHVELVIKKLILFSAEGKGLVDVPWEERVKGSQKIEAYRFVKKINEKELNKYVDQIRGSGYAFSRWILNTIILICFFSTLVSLVGLIFSLIFAGIMAAITLILFFPVREYLQKIDVITHDCSGATSLIYTKLKRFVPKYRPRNDTPNTIYQVIKNLELNGIVVRVY